MNEIFRNKILSNFSRELAEITQEYIMDDTLALVQPDLSQLYCAVAILESVSVEWDLKKVQKILEIEQFGFRTVLRVKKYEMDSLTRERRLQDESDPLAIEQRLKAELKRLDSLVLTLRQKLSPYYHDKSKTSKNEVNKLMKRLRKSDLFDLVPLLKRIKDDLANPNAFPDRKFYKKLLKLYFNLYS